MWSFIAKFAMGSLGKKLVGAAVGGVIVWQLTVAVKSVAQTWQTSVARTTTNFIMKEHEKSTGKIEELQKSLAQYIEKVLELEAELDEKKKELKKKELKAKEKAYKAQAKKDSKLSKQLARIEKKCEGLGMDKKINRIKKKAGK